MPGEERKFKRRRIVAFIPGCKRECDEADSQADATGVAMVGVDVEAVAGVAVGDGSGVGVGSGTIITVGKGTGVIVSVGTAPLAAVRETSGVTLCADTTVVVGESKGVRVDTAAVVALGEGSGTEVDVNEREVGEAGAVVGAAGLMGVGTTPAPPAGVDIVSVDIGAGD